MTRNTWLSAPTTNLKGENLRLFPSLGEDIHPCLTISRRFRFIPSKYDCRFHHCHLSDQLKLQDTQKPPCFTPHCLSASFSTIPEWSLDFVQVKHACLTISFLQTLHRPPFCLDSFSSLLPLSPAHLSSHIHFPKSYWSSVFGKSFPTPCRTKHPPLLTLALYLLLTAQSSFLLDCLSLEISCGFQEDICCTYSKF